MILNGAVTLILRYFTDIGSFRGAKVVEDVVANRSSRSLSHLLMSFLYFMCVSRQGQKVASLKLNICVVLYKHIDRIAHWQRFFVLSGKVVHRFDSERQSL